MVWVSSSWLIQRIVVPASTVIVGGRYLESRMSTTAGETARASAPSATSAASVTNEAARSPGPMCLTPLPTRERPKRSIAGARHPTFRYTGGRRLGRSPFTTRALEDPHHDDEDAPRG